MSRWQVTIYMGGIALSSQRYHFWLSAWLAQWIASPPHMRALFPVRAVLEKVER